nr:hypothetical protein [Tanacetum cinerariifolium]
NGIPWIDEKPWIDNRVWSKLIDNIHLECNPLHFKNETAIWPTCNWKEDGYCNTGNLPGFIHDGNSIFYEDYEWYDMIKDGKLKKEALINKRILEESMNVMEESSNNEWAMIWLLTNGRIMNTLLTLKPMSLLIKKTYNKVCQIVMDLNDTQGKQGWFDEHELMEDDDDDIDDL